MSLQCRQSLRAKLAGRGNPRPPNEELTSELRERRQARQGVGVMIAKSGNIYTRNPRARRVRRITTTTSQAQEGSSQGSQVIDGSILARSHFAQCQKCYL